MTKETIIVGSGINSLVAGAILTRAGVPVRVLERNKQLGGAIRTEPATLPGYVHELLSSWHPLFVGGPAYAELKDELEKRGLSYKNTPMPTGVICKAGSAILFTDPNQLSAEMSRLGDGENWSNFMAEFGGKIDLAFGLLGTDFWRPSAIKLARTAQKRLGRRGVLATGSELLEPANSWLERQFNSEVTRALLAPWALHNGLGPDDAASAFITKVISAAIAFGGMPVPIGGGIRLVEALAKIITDHGGKLETNADVVEILATGSHVSGVLLGDGRKIESETVIASTTPTSLYNQLLAKIEKPKEVTSSVAKIGRAHV